LLFEKRAPADFVEAASADHGRIELRSIWCSTALNAHIEFPKFGQVFLVERESIDKKTGKPSRDIALGVTSRTPEHASPQRVLAINRGHWAIESVHYLTDWNYDEDRSRIRPGFAPENITRFRRFAVGVLKAFQKPDQNRRVDAQALLSYPSRLRLLTHDPKRSNRYAQSLNANLPCLVTCDRNLCCSFLISSPIAVHRERWPIH